MYVCYNMVLEYIHLSSVYNHSIFIRGNECDKKNNEKYGLRYLQIHVIRCCDTLTHSLARNTHGYNDENILL